MFLQLVAPNHLYPINLPIVIKEGTNVTTYGTKYMWFTSRMKGDRYGTANFCKVASNKDYLFTISKIVFQGTNGYYYPVARRNTTSRYQN